MEQKNDMALASMILGVISIVLSCCCFLGVMLGSLAVILAALSRVDVMCRQAKTGLITGIVGIVISMLSIVVWIALLEVLGGV